MIVTERSGYFEKNGLWIKTRLMHGVKSVVKGLMEGEIQFGNLAAPALLRAVLTQGADAVYLTGGIHQQFLKGRLGVEMTQPGMPEIPYSMLQGLKIVLGVMSKEIPAAADIDPCRFVDDGFIRELDESGFISSLLIENNNIH